MEHPDKIVHGIRFHWDHDAAAYEAQVSPEDIEDVFNDAWEQAQELYTGQDEL